MIVSLYIVIGDRTFATTFEKLNAIPQCRPTGGTLPQVVEHTEGTLMQPLRDVVLFHLLEGRQSELVVVGV
jgi:hypothetical protein